MSRQSSGSCHVKMGLTLLCVLSALVAVCAGTGELQVLHAPQSLRFSGRESLYESVIKDVYSAALGFSIQSNRGSGWSGVTIADPFGSAEAVVELFAEGVPSLGSKANLKGHKYPIKTDYNEYSTWDSMQRRISQRFPEGGNKLVNVDLSDGLNAVNKYNEVFGEVDAKVGKYSLKALKPKVNDEDYQFLQQLELLKSITEKVANGAIVPDNKVDFFYIAIPALHPLSDLHGENSAATNEAKTLLGDAISKLTDAFKNAYDGSVLVTLVTTDSSHTRRARSLLATPDAKIDLSEVNLATTYTQDYPVIFNIIFWFVVALILTLIAVSYVIGDMDPGRDSIIYRMTSNRMKKDN